MNMSATTELCTENPILAAFAEGISHTDIGLTSATVVLTLVTAMMIDDRKWAKVRKSLTPHMPTIKISRHVKVTRTITSADGASTKDEAEASETVEE